MDTVELLKNKLDEKIQLLQKGDLNKKQQLEMQYSLITECLNALENENIIVQYDFSKVLELLKEKNLIIDDVDKSINEIKQVIQIRNAVPNSIEFTELHKETLKNLVESLKKARDIVSKDIEEQKNTEVKIDDKKIKNIEGMISILKGEGRRKYYTEEEFSSVYDLIKDDPLNEQEQILMSFLNTRNFMGKRKKEEEKIENVIELYKEFLPQSEFANDINIKHSGLFMGLIKKYEKEIVMAISINRAREILEFFKEEGILERFGRRALLGITLYGRPNYIKELYYDKISALPSKVQKKYYEDILGTVWVQEDSKTRRKSFRTRRPRTPGGPDEDEDSLYSSVHGVSYNEFNQNVEIINQYRDLFSEKYDVDAFDAHLLAKTEDTENLEKVLPLFRLVVSSNSAYFRKNVKLIDVFTLGRQGKLPVSAIVGGDIEDKIHLAIELGLLNPPRDEISREKDKDIVLNDKFLENTAKAGLPNQTIRNYYARNITRLHLTGIDEFGYLFYLKKQRGETTFLNDFFSDYRAGTRSGDYEEQIKEAIYDMADIIDNNFLTSYYGEFVEDYYEYDSVISTSNFSIFNEKVEEMNHYFDEDILHDELITRLEDNNRVYDSVVYDGVKQEVPNEYVYKFGNVLISRYKVLRNASILKEEYGMLNENMIKTCIVRNSFLDENDFHEVMNSLSKERGL